MHELITLDIDRHTVSARELHEKLNVGTRFNDWFPRMREYGFEEGTDFYSKMSKTEMCGRPSIDYDISMDMAKQICMIQRTPEGKACRQYLIDLEKAWNTPEQVFARALRLADKVIEEQKEQIILMKPKALFADAVSASRTSILIGELAKLIRQNGVDMGQKRLFSWLRVNGYLIKRGGTDWNMPTQRAMEMGLFEIKESVVNNPDGTTKIVKTTKVTGKGQQYFINKFLAKKEADNPAFLLSAN